MALVISISACEKDVALQNDQTETSQTNVGLTLNELSPDLKSRILYGPEGGTIEQLNSNSLQARNSDLRVDTLVDLFVSQFDSEDILNTFLLEKGYPAWQTTLLPGEGYGENVFVTPVVGECELKGNLFVFHDNLKPLASHRMDYYSYDYTDMGYLYGGYFMSDEEMQALYMVAGGQATSQYVMLGTVDSFAVLFRQFVSEAGGIGGELSGRTTTCTILYCEGLETTLPPGYYDPTADNDTGNPGNGGGGGGGNWPPMSGPGVPGWHYISTQYWGNFTWNAPPPLNPNIASNGGGSGGGGIYSGGIGSRGNRSFVNCIPTRLMPDIKDRMHSVSLNNAQLISRSGNCKWITVPGVEDGSIYTYLGNTQLGDDWANDVDGFECKGIAFEDEAMGIDFAHSIRNILREIGADWEMIKCLAENPEFAAAANEALDHFSGLTSCEGKSIPEIIEEEILASCGSGDAGARAANELVESLQEEEWIDLSGVQGNPKLRCLMNLYIASENSLWCNATTQRFSGDTNFDLKFEIQSDPSRNARTSDAGLSDFDPSISIYFTPSYINSACHWEVMRTIAHESIHAEMLAYAADRGQNFLNIHDVYDFHRITENHGHDLMAEKYRGRIVEALISIFGDEYSAEQYEAMAWGGLGDFEYIYLDGTVELRPISQAWINLSVSEKQNVRAILDGLATDCIELDCP